jgi:hypothetical protein
VKSFNINHSIEVKLNDFGYQILADNHNETFKDIDKDHVPRKLEYYKDKANKYGYTSFQLWDYMNIFGPFMGFNSKVPFETEILINEKDLKDVK